MSDQILKEIYDSDRYQRVLIYRTDTGKFTYEQEYFSRDPHERCWVPIRNYTVGVYDSPEAAEKEARANIDWMNEL